MLSDRNTLSSCRSSVARRPAPVKSRLPVTIAARTNECTSSRSQSTRSVLWSWGFVLEAGLVERAGNGFQVGEQGRGVRVGVEKAHHRHACAAAFDVACCAANLSCARYASSWCMFSSVARPPECGDCGAGSVARSARAAQAAGTSRARAAYATLRRSSLR